LGTLVIRDGEGAGGEHPLDGEVVVGREPGSAGLVLSDPGVSRRHAAVRESAGSITVEDLGSSNGTFVNGRAISGAVELADGDEIQIGGTVISVHSSEAATALLGGAAPATAHHPGPAAPPPAPPPRAQPEAAPRRLGPGPNDGGDNIPALAAIFLGPLSIVLVLFTSGGAFFVSLICAIGAIVCGNIGMRNVDRGRTGKHRSLAHIGRITGIVGAVLSVLALIAFVIVASALDATEDSLSGLIDRIEEEIDGTELPDVDSPDVDAPEAPEVPSDQGGETP
jgi:FHA domain